MTGSSLLPVALHKKKLYFLFGKENELEKSAKGFSDFGGGVEPGEKIYQTALREGAEELTGFLGDKDQLGKYIAAHGCFPLYAENIDYHTHIFKIDFDARFPEYYNQNHRFLWDRLENMLSKTKLFEKIEIEWFEISTLRRRLHEFRPFYQDMVRMILENETAIRHFCNSRRTQTKKKRSGGLFF